MKNIREEKGFTYGISSSLVLLSEASYLLIGTDVNKELTNQTLKEIEHEIAALQQEVVSENELEVAKNYIIGTFAGSLNTPFELTDRQKIIILEGLPANFYDNYIQEINAVSAADVMAMARKYLSINDFATVIVGGK